MTADSTAWDAATYDSTSAPQQSWAGDVLERLATLAPDARVLDIGCGTGRVTERICDLVPEGEVIALDAAPAMVRLARERLGARAQVLEGDVLDLQLEQPVDLVVSTATLHWVNDHDRLWRVLAGALAAGGRIETQCGGEGNIARVRAAIDEVSRELAPEFIGWSPWHFAGTQETERRLREAGFKHVRCWLSEKPTTPEDAGAFIRTSILPAHLERLDAPRRDAFAEAVVERVQLPLDYVRLNVSAVRAH